MDEKEPATYYVYNLHLVLVLVLVLQSPSLASLTSTAFPQVPYQHISGMHPSSTTPTSTATPTGTSTFSSEFAAPGAASVSSGPGSVGNLLSQARASTSSSLYPASTTPNSAYDNPAQGKQIAAMAHCA